MIYIYYIIILLIITLSLFTLIGLNIYYNLFSYETKNLKYENIINNGKTYTTPSIDMKNYNFITIEGKIDHNNNDDKLIIETSPDNINWIDSGITISPVSTDYFYTDRIDSNYIRIKFTNTSSQVKLNIFFTKTR